MFILGIGVISIAALFPAGIAQQRQSVDDITGPIVAQNALAILRTKLRLEDFGFGSGYTVDGDFAWSRPAVFIDDVTLPGGTFVPRGSVSIFNDGSLPNPTNSEVLWNSFLYGANPPTIIITQRERYYPMRSINSGDPRPPKPQYVWDCMFRRFQGKVMVAIFVYRTTIVGGGNVNYAVPPNPNPFYPNEPPMPMSLNITTSEIWADEGAWDADGDQFIRGTKADEPYNTADQRQSWQEPGQWILDQNNNLHRVLSQNRESANQSVMVELIRPVPSLPDLPVYFLDRTTLDPTTANVVSNIFYIPREVTLDGVPVRLTTVYVTVREL